MEMRNQVAKNFISWKAWAERQFETTVKQLHTDGGGEFMATEFQGFLAVQGIEHITTVPYSPDMNGACKLWNRVIVQTASTMLHTANLPINVLEQSIYMCANDSWPT